MSKYIVFDPESFKILLSIDETSGVAAKAIAKKKFGPDWDSKYGIATLGALNSVAIESRT